MSVNKVILVGNLGADPEVRKTSNDQAVANMRIATSEYAGKGKEERTEWHNIVAFGTLAETAQKYLKKGRQIYVEGRLQTRKWADKEGTDRYTTEIVASTVQFLGGKETDEVPKKVAPSRNGSKPSREELPF